VPSPSPIPESTIGKVLHSEIRLKNEDNLESKVNSKYYDQEPILYYILYIHTYIIIKLSKHFMSGK